MTAFFASVVATVLLCGVVVYVARRRPPGTPLTWGEAFVGGFFIFALLLMIYGVVPDKFLKWADGDLKWRSDKIGIPLGPFGHLLNDWFGIGSKNLLWHNGIKFGGRGKVVFTAQDMRDIIATVIYGVGLGMQIGGWMWWTRRGRKAERPAIEKSSAFGRPLVRG